MKGLTMKNVLLRTINPVKDWAWSALIAFGVFMIVSAIALNAAATLRQNFRLSAAANSARSGEVQEFAQREGVR